MAEIGPFTAVTYDSDRAGPLASLVAPPYDVISPSEQDALYDTSPNNIIRLILNRESPETRYESAAHFLHDSLDSGILRQDESPCLYEYRQSFANPADGLIH